jgi:hypothetical protein
LYRGSFSLRAKLESARTKKIFSGRANLGDPAASGATVTPSFDSVDAMPRDGAIIFSDLTGKLGVLRVTCEKCRRDGRYILPRLIRNRGRDGKVIDWLDELTAECPKKIARNMNDPCGAVPGFGEGATYLPHFSIISRRRPAGMCDLGHTRLDADVV